jgi:molybdate transport system substrate-binding protein
MLVNPENGSGLNPLYNGVYFDHYEPSYTTMESLHSHVFPGSPFLRPGIFANHRGGGGQRPIRHGGPQSGIPEIVRDGASGKFATQIRNGAPFDVFISADMDFPDSLYKWGFARDKPIPYAYGKLVLWTLKDLDLDKGLALLMDSGVSKAALADPKRAPYGREAVKALKKSGLYERVLPKLVYGENISQVSQYVLTGNADVGFNAKSVVMANEVKGKGKWKEVDSTLYDRIAQGAIVSKYGQENHSEASSRFLAFLHSDLARNILFMYGYALP